MIDPGGGGGGSSGANMFRCVETLPFKCINSFMAKSFEMVN